MRHIDFELLKTARKTFKKAPKNTRRLFGTLFLLRIARLSHASHIKYIFIFFFHLTYAKYIWKFVTCSTCKESFLYFEILGNVFVFIFRFEFRVYFRLIICGVCQIMLNCCQALVACSRNINTPFDE